MEVELEELNDRVNDGRGGWIIICNGNGSDFDTYLVGLLKLLVLANYFGWILVVSLNTSYSSSLPFLLIVFLCRIIIMI